MLIKDIEKNEKGCRWFWAKKRLSRKNKRWGAYKNSKGLVLRVNWLCQNLTN